ncbi:MAG: hypothetical protein RL720_1087 [Actinomycetota bacterium]
MHAAVEAGLDIEQYARCVAPEPEALITQVWGYALRTGAPFATVLSVCAEAFTTAAEHARQARVHLAGPQAATRLVMVLPALALAGGVLAGYNPIPFLVGSAVGWVLLLFAAGMVVLSQKWSTRMVHHAQQGDWARGMAAEILGISLRSGSSLQSSHQWAQEIARDFVAEKDAARLELSKCDHYVHLAFTTGVPLAELVHALAKQERNEAQAEAVMRIERLSVQLMIPLGVCVLPAFIAVGVLPLVASVISSTALNS